MCTLIVLAGVVPGCPLVIAANRDERPSRTSTNPTYRTPDVFAPRDLSKRGTWIGVSKLGWFVGLTNLDDWHDDGTRSRASRGHLVAECLEAPSFTEALDFAEGIDPRHYPGYHLFLSDGTTHVLHRNDGRSIDVRRLESGLHPITAMGSGIDHCDRSRRIRDLFEATKDSFLDRETLPQHLDLMLEFHGTADGEDGSCVHAPYDRFQTVSSTTVMLDAETREWLFRWRNGKPCTGEFWYEERVPLRAE